MHFPLVRPLDVVPILLSSRDDVVDLLGQTIRQRVESHGGEAADDRTAGLRRAVTLRSASHWRQGERMQKTAVPGAAAEQADGVAGTVGLPQGRRGGSERGSESSS